MITNPYSHSTFAETQLLSKKAKSIHKIDKNNFAYIFSLTKNWNMLYATKYDKKLINLAKKNNCIYTLIESYITHKNSKPTNNPIKQIIPRFTTIIDLTKTSNELLNSMHPKGRYNIKLAEKKGVLIQESNDINLFYNLLKTTAQRDNFALNSLEFYQTFFNNLKKNKHAKLFIAYSQNTPVAGMLNIYLDKTAIYYYGASSNEHRNLMAPYLLQWHAILDAKNNKYKFYDFLGVANPHNKKDPLAGVTYFKQKFGGNMQSWPKSQIIVHKPILYLALKIKKILKI